MSDRNPLDQSLKNSAEAAGGMRDRQSRQRHSRNRCRSDWVVRLQRFAIERTNFRAGQKVQQFAHVAAERLSTTADYMRSHDAKRMLADVERVVKNNPGPSLVIAAAFGFVIGRALTRD